ncbi:MAG: helix-turn-helix transcriptional regulator [Patescibacteria group bacterium]
MTTLEDLKKEAFLKDPKVKEMYDDLEPEYEIIRSMIRKRIERRMSQAQLARKVGTKQSAIARLESGGYNPSLEMLQKVAKALDAKLKISIS